MLFSLFCVLVAIISTSNGTSLIMCYKKGLTNMGMPLCNILYKQEGTQFAYATYAAQQKLFYALFSSEKVLLNANG